MKRLAVPGRPDWRHLVAHQGCTWHDDGPDGCWREDVAWVLTPDEISLLKETAAGIIDLFHQAAHHVVRKNLWTRLGFTAAAARIIRNSMERGEPDLLGRFDFLIDENGRPRLLEFNADNALSLVETAVLQREWRRTVLPEKDQFNELHSSLVHAWRHSGFQRVHCTWRPRHPEVEGTARYMASVIREAGLEAEMIALHCIGWHRRRSTFVDAAGRDIQCCWKIYPWEWMLHEPFARHLSTTACRFVEPAWRLLLGHKGLLSVLWQLFPDHPALLPCRDDPPSGNTSWVAKPVLGREGGNITIHRHGHPVEETGGEFTGQRCVYQEFVAAPAHELCSHRTMAD